jgi:hypothetical protein
LLSSFLLDRRICQLHMLSQTMSLVGYLGIGSWQLLALSYWWRFALFISVRRLLWISTRVFETINARWLLVLLIASSENLN